MFRFTIKLLATTSLAVLAMEAAAQAYPNKHIRLVVAVAPSGGPDIVARLIAPKLSEALGQPVVVDNRVGSNGNIAGDVVAKAAPDGYTILLAMDSILVINPHLYTKMSFDPLTELVPVTSLVSNGFFLAANPSVPAKTFAEFIDYARRSKPPLNYASGGNGSQHHLTMERLKARAGIEMIHVPYKSGGPATMAVVGGEVPVMMSGTSTAGQIRSGRLRALAFTGPKRSDVLPDVPTIAEFYPDFVMLQWYGLFAPAKTPEAILSRLRTEVQKVLAGADIRDKLRNSGGVEVWISSPQEFATQIRHEYDVYGKLVRETGVKID